MARTTTMTTDNGEKMTPAFPQSPLPLRTFLNYLGHNKEVSVKLFNHSIEKGKAEPVENEGESTSTVPWKVTQTTPVAFQILKPETREKVSDANAGSFLKMEDVKKSTAVRVVPKAQYVLKKRTIRPGKLSLFSQKAWRVTEGTFVLFI